MNKRELAAALSGQSFTTPDGRGGDVEFAFPTLKRSDGWPRVGAEGAVVPCVRIIDDEERLSVLKQFHVADDVRMSRSKHLIGMGLGASHSWRFQGLPYAWIDDVDVNGAPIFGHVARFVGAEFGGPATSFEELLRAGAWDGRDDEDRRRLAGNIADTVAALESFDLVHGDLSSDNVVVGAGPGAPDVAVLVDYDAYFHSDAAPLPRRIDGEIVNPLGTPGFRAPDLAAVLENDPDGVDESFSVTSDRFALAVLICEMASLRRDDVERRGRLVTREMLDSRSLETLEPEVRHRFPEGFLMLEHALRASGPRDMPNAADWKRALVEAPLPGPYLPPALAPAPDPEPEPAPEVEAVLEPVEDEPEPAPILEAEIEAPAEEPEIEIAATPAPLPAAVPAAEADSEPLQRVHDPDPAPPAGPDGDIFDPELERAAAADEAGLPTETDGVVLEPAETTERFAPFPYNPMVKVAKVTGRDVAPRRPGRLKSKEGHFGLIDSRLSELRFKRENAEDGPEIYLIFDWPYPVWRRAAGRGGRLVRHESGEVIRVGRGDRLASHGWRFQVIDESDFRI